MAVPDAAGGSRCTGRQPAAPCAFFGAGRHAHAGDAAHTSARRPMAPRCLIQPYSVQLAQSRESLEESLRARLGSLEPLPTRARLRLAVSPWPRPVLPPALAWRRRARRGQDLFVLRGAWRRPARDASFLAGAVRRLEALRCRRPGCGPSGGGLGARGAGDWVRFRPIAKTRRPTWQRSRRSCTTLTRPSTLVWRGLDRSSTCSRFHDVASVTAP